MSPRHIPTGAGIHARASILQKRREGQHRKHQKTQPQRCTRRVAEMGKHARSTRQKPPTHKNVAASHLECLLLTRIARARVRGV